ncbi:DNA repair protein RecN [Microbacterium sp. zg.Y1090]|uniref:DNA repair protein RecN n=1 Tax=Microbacterium wangruii TaxID=3049073 RepID=UPI00214D9CEE|nr:MULTISPECIES: DNA repair protein RecN [unclassified Microbacterium]MCR2819981.1 DNA repair protein RecN [Microbacterium sp. zg.Y1090]WIM27534.1 DNA repair protein RecN [Microbacterium sp. zg-Y1090]
MIEEIRLRDLGVIAQATLPMGRGFTAITGETGAGKTMVVTGLGLLLGQRADSGAVRSGAAQASVEGTWIVPEDGAVAERVREAGGDLEPIGGGDAELYLGRTLSSEGRSRATVGGRTAPAGVLADLADQLVVVHGQSDQLRLRSSVAQRDALDRFGGAPVADALAAYREAYETWRGLDAELTHLTGESDTRAREAEELRLLLADIERVDPQPGEDDELARRAERLSHVEELRIAAASAHTALSSDDDAPDVAVLAAEARRALERAADRDDTLAALAEQAADIGYRAVDLAQSLSGYLADLDETGPQELALVEARRAELATLTRVHGTVDAAIALLENGSARLAELDDDGDRIARLERERDAAASVLDAAAAALTAARTAAAGRLGAAVTAELRALALPDARLVVELAPGAASAAGRDDVTILLAPHPGADPRPVAKGASGGELSRVMLALEVVIAATEPVPTFVFDEVDAGIGGAAAIEVGRRLARLAESSQVVVVTHLAQVAAFATNHLSVVKANDGSVTASSVRRLEGADREAEMARLLSGMTDSEAALTHARELLSLGAAGLIG